MGPFEKLPLRFFRAEPEMADRRGLEITRKQFDKTYVAVSFINHDREIILNFIVADGRDGWVILDVESPHDSLRMFLAQYKN
jgi:hypothetical protein